MHTPTFHTILIVGDSFPKFAELTQDQIDALWNDIEARLLPKVKLGWFDHSYSWHQLSTNPKPFTL